MRKKIAIVIVLLVVVSLLTGCGDVAWRSAEMIACEKAENQLHAKHADATIVEQTCKQMIDSQTYKPYVLVLTTYMLPGGGYGAFSTEHDVAGSGALAGGICAVLVFGLAALLFLVIKKWKARALLLILAVILLLNGIGAGYMALADDAQVLSSTAARMYIDAATRLTISKEVSELNGGLHLVSLWESEFQLQYDSEQERHEATYGGRCSASGLELPTSEAMSYTYYVPAYFHILMGVISVVLLSGAAALTFLAFRKRKVQAVQTDVE